MAKTMAKAIVKSDHQVHSVSELLNPRPKFPYINPETKKLTASQH